MTLVCRLCYSILPDLYPKMAKYGLSIWEILRISSALGLVIALPISGGTILGFILDKNLGSGPIFTIVFLLVGIVVGVLGLIRRMRQISESLKGS